MPLPAGIDAAWLKRTFLTGVDLTDDDGEPFPDDVYELPLEAALETLETDVGIKMFPGHRTERFDVTSNSHWEFYQMRMSSRPVREITAVRYRYGNDPGDELPLDWVNLLGDGTTGVVDLVPIGQSFGLSSLAISLMAGANTWNRVPGWLEYEYDYGFGTDDRPIPAALKMVLGWTASLLALDTAGDLIAGAGIASMSIGLNGLSQSIGTTSSATNAGYGAKIKSYQDQIRYMLPKLRAKYRGFDFFAV